MNSIMRFLSRYDFIKGNFLILLVSWVVMYFANPIPLTYASLYFKDVLGADDFLLSIITFAGLITLALVQFPGGYLADKHGRRWLIVGMTYAMASSLFLFVFAPSWPFIVVGMIIQNFCLIYQPALFSIMLDSVSPENRGAGFTVLGVITSLVGLPAALIAGYLILIFNLDIGMRIAYGILLVAYFVAAAYRVRIKETIVSNSVGSRSNFLEAFREYPRSVRESLQVWKKVPRSMLHLFISYAFMSSMVVACQTYFVVYATEILKVSRFEWAIVLAFMSLSVAVPSILAGLRMDVAGRKRYLMLGYAMYIPAMLLFLNASFYMLLLAFFFFGMAQMLQFSSYQSMMGDLVPRDLRGKVVGCSQFFIYLSQAITQIIIGVVYSYVSNQLPFIFLAVVGMSLCIFVSLKVFESDVKQV